MPVGPSEKYSLDIDVKRSASFQQCLKNKGKMVGWSLKKTKCALEDGLGWLGS